MKRKLTELEEHNLGKRIAEIFLMKRCQEHPERYATEIGCKTTIGVARVFCEIVRQVDDLEKNTTTIYLGS